MLYMTYILEFVIDGFYQRSFPEHDFVTQVHERVFHVPFYLSDKVYVIHKQLLKQLLADIPSVGQQFSEQPFSESLVFQRFTVVNIP